MVLQVGADSGDLFLWLGAANPSEFDRFRIPELFHGPSRDSIRAVVAGAVAGKHHRTPIGGQMLSGEQWIPSDEVKEKDDNVVIVKLVIRNGSLEGQISRVQSRSEILNNELAGKGKVRDVPTMALHVTLKLQEADDMAAGRKVMAAFRYPLEASLSDDIVFVASYPETPPAMFITRNTKGVITVSGGSLGGHLLLYQWATGDHRLTDLAEKLHETEANDVEQSTVNTSRNAAELARETHRVFTDNKVLGVEGAKNLIAGYIGNLDLLAPIPWMIWPKFVGRGSIPGHPQPWRPNRRGDAQHK
jgi:hypothetical protein